MMGLCDFLMSVRMTWGGMEMPNNKRPVAGPLVRMKIPDDQRREYQGGSWFRTGARPERVYHESLSAEVTGFLLDKNLTEGHSQAD